MSNIKPENINRLDGLEKAMKEHLDWLSKDMIGTINETVNRSRDLKLFVIGLSVGILGIIFPLLMLSTQSLVGVNYLITSLLLFSITVLYGLVGVLIPTFSEVTDLPKITCHHIEETLKTITRIQEIKKIDNNNIAGEEYDKLKNSYKHMSLRKDNLILKILYSYEDLTIYTLFFYGFIFLVLTMFLNLRIFLI